MTKSVLSEGDVLALDFDGVIADSLEECLVVGFNAFSQYRQQDRRLFRLDEMDFQMSEEAKRIRKYIRTGEDYVFIFLALHREITIDDQNKFDAFKEQNHLLQPEFRELFYQQREVFSTELSDKWIALNPLYPDMENFLKQVPSIEPS